MQHFLCSFDIYIKFSMFWKKKQPDKSSISEVIDSKRCAYLNAKKGLFAKTLCSERVNMSQNFLKSAEKYFYRTFFIILGQFKQDKIILNQMWDITTAW